VGRGEKKFVEQRKETVLLDKVKKKAQLLKESAERKGEPGEESEK